MIKTTYDAQIKKKRQLIPDDLVLCGLTSLAIAIINNRQVFLSSVWIIKTLSCQWLQDFYREEKVKRVYITWFNK
jgi:hypothetical protein